MNILPVSRGGLVRTEGPAVLNISHTQTSLTALYDWEAPVRTDWETHKLESSEGRGETLNVADIQGGLFNSDVFCEPSSISSFKNIYTKIKLLWKAGEELGLECITESGSVALPATHKVQLTYFILEWIHRIYGWG